jgi:hypothetical protein
MITFKTLAIGMALFGVGAARAQSATADVQATVAAACCHVAAGTVVELETTEPVSSRDRKHGDRFGLRLHAPLLVDDMVVLPAGTPGVGEIVHADRARGGGKPGELILAARYLRVGATQVSLHGMTLGATGKDKTRASMAVATAVGPLALFIHGGEIEIPTGTLAQAKLLADLDRPPQAGATALIAADRTTSAAPPRTPVTTAPPTPLQESH